MPTIAYDRRYMSNLPRQDAEVVSARKDFSRRLRELRILRGFRTARSLARTLEIDENRYTRYERAEVEPDLDMIRRICSTLSVTPSDLLGGQEPPAGARSTAAGRRSSGSRARVEPSSAGVNGVFGIASAAWELAEVVTRARDISEPGKAAGQGPAPSPLADISQTGLLYRSIMKQPFEAIAGLLQEPAITSAPSELAATLRQRIDDLVRHLKQPSSGGG